MIKKSKKKVSKTPQSKEQTFIKKTTNILLVVIIILVVIFAGVEAFGGVDLGASNDSLTALTKLQDTVNTQNIISHQISDENKPALIEKMNASGFNLLTDDEFDYEKYSSATIPLSHNISLTAEEIGLIYSYIFLDHPDAYNIILYQIDITSSDGVTTFKTVASIDFYKLYTKHTDSDTSSSSLPKRVYIINSATFDGSEWTHSNPLFNNLSADESKSIKSLVKSVNNAVDLNSYVFTKLTVFIQDLANKTNSTYSFGENLVSFNLK